MLTIPPEYNVHLDFYIRPPCEQISLFGALSDVPEASTTWFATHHPHYKENPGMTESAYNPFLLRQSRKRISLLVVSSDRIVKFATYHPHYKEKFGMIEPMYNPFLLRQRPKLILLLRVSYDYIVKIMKLPCCEPKAGKHLFAVYHPYYKEEYWMTNAAYDSGLRYSSDKLRTIAFLYELKAFFVPSYAAQTVEFLSDDQTLSNKQLQWQITNKSRGLRYVKPDPRDTHLFSQISYVICLANVINESNIIHWCPQLIRGVLATNFYAMANGFDIKKQHWERY